jgi:3-ketosteroid 9alpha-monooxygenase subunit A
VIKNPSSVFALTENKKDSIMSRFSFGVFPRGWFQVGWLSDFDVRGECRKRAFGCDLLLKAQTDGAVYCQDVVTLQQWKTCRRADAVFVYHDAFGHPPAFELPELTDLGKEWICVGRLAYDYQSHVQELIENAVDLAHFANLHRFVGQAQLMNLSFADHDFSVTIEAPKLILGIPCMTDLTISYRGMGFSMGKTQRPFGFAAMVSCLPIENDNIRQHLTLFFKQGSIPGWGHLIAPILRWHVHSDLQREIAILNHKRYLARPMLVRGDGPIMRVRHWCEQYYREFVQEVAC